MLEFIGRLNCHVTTWGGSRLAGLGRLGFYPWFPVWSWAAHM